MDLRSFGNYIKELKESKNITTIALAEQTGITVDTLNNIIYGRVSSVKLETASKLVAALDGSLDQLAGICPPTPSSDGDSPSLPSNSVSYDAESYIQAMHASHRQEIAVLKEDHSNTLTILQKVYDARISDLKQARNVWCIVACCLMAVICGWLIWDLSHPSAGLIRYAQSLGIIGLRG